MFRPAMWPSLGRLNTEHGYITQYKMKLQKYQNQYTFIKQRGKESQSKTHKYKVSLIGNVLMFHWILQYSIIHHHVTI
jgi:hypothetical protein